MRSVLPSRFSQLWLGPSVLPEVQAASGVKWGGAYGDYVFIGTNPLCRKSPGERQVQRHCARREQPQAGIHGAGIADAANG